MGDLSTNLSRSEFACKCGCGFDTVDIVLVPALQFVVEHYGFKMKKRMHIEITSGCRCAAHNKAIKGSDGSWHLVSRAADFKLYWVNEYGRKVYVPAYRVAQFLDSQFPTTYGIGTYDTFTHLDTRAEKARWDFRKGK